RLWRGGDLRCTRSIFYAGSVLLLCRTCSYNWGCRWMGPYSPRPLNLLIGKPSRWVGYETHSQSWGMIRLK
ncbi:hypothetical protein Goshw_023288, partial [Gossypium schwendimanii]|nr:hypothetical protein [Gossypium schwendimanii]